MTTGTSDTHRMDRTQYMTTKHQQLQEIIYCEKVVTAAVRERT